MALLCCRLASEFCEVAGHKDVVEKLEQVMTLFALLTINMLVGLTCSLFWFNPLIATSDQDRICPYNINIILRWKVLRIKKKIN